MRHSLLDEAPYTVEKTEVNYPGSLFSADIIMSLMDTSDCKWRK